MNIHCARSRSNASKLDAVLVEQCFRLCLVATRDVLSSLHIFVQSVPRSLTLVQVFAHVLGHLHGRQPTVILREPVARRKANAWICARRATDHDPEIVTDNNRTSVFFVISC